MDMEAMKKMMETSTPESRQQGMEAWKTWMSTNAGIFADMGGPVGKNTQVSATGAMQMTNDIAGYSVVKAESVESATALLAGNPHFGMPGATVDLMEIMPTGM